MKSYFEMVKEFHLAFGHPVADKAGFASDDLMDFRERFNAEEEREQKKALAERDLVEFADAIGDRIYVLLGEALVCGIDMDRVFAAIHRSNMAKLGPDGKPIVSECGNKILKPVGWVGPQREIASILGIES